METGSSPKYSEVHYPSVLAQKLKVSVCAEIQGKGVQAQQRNEVADAIGIHTDFKSFICEIGVLLAA